jgi:Ca2+-binding EF-hand superfamily protein
MKPIITLISLSTILVCLAPSAQTQPRAAGSGLAERFMQLDRNSDGKLTREEAGQMPMFDQWDANKDGAVTMEELNAF